MALVHEEQGVVGDVLEEGRRRLAGAPAGEVAGIVLDAGARAGGLDHLQVEDGALLQPLGLEQLAVLDQPVQARLQLLADGLDRLLQGGARGDVVAVGVDADLRQLGGLLPRERVELVDRLHLVAEQGHAPGAVLVVGGEDLQGVATFPERAALEGLVVALVLLGHEIGEQALLVHLVADVQVEGHGRVGLDRADAVDAGDRGDDDDVVALQDRAGGRVAHPVDLLVDRGILLDVGVGARDVGLGLVVVVVADEVLDRVVGEERAELRIELGGEGLVVRENQGRALGLLDHLGHGEGLARAGDAEQDLVGFVAPDALGELGDGGGLVAGGGIVADELEAAAALGLLRARGPVRDPGGQLGAGGVVGEGARDVLQTRLDAGGGGGTGHERKVGGPGGLR